MKIDGTGVYGFGSSEPDETTVQELEEERAYLESLLDT